jgi:hypothetical protein
MTKLSKVDIAIAVLQDYLNKSCSENWRLRQSALDVLKDALKVETVIIPSL